MYTLKEEVLITVYLILFGIYIFSTLDIVTLICQKIKNNFNKILLQILYWIFQIYITYLFSYNLMDGYVPIYFILFIYIGYYLYNLIFKKNYTKTIKVCLYVLNKLFKLIIILLKPLIYSRQIVKWLHKFIKHEKNVLCKVLIKKDKKDSNLE